MTHPPYLNPGLWWHGDGEPALLGTRCRACSEVFFGPRMGCENCQSDDLETLPLSRTGTLYSYTILRNRPPGDFGGTLTDEGWMAVGLVELPEGVRVLAPLDVPDDHPAIGLALELAPDTVGAPDGPALAHRFRPAP